MDKNIDLIDNYLTGNLSQEQATAFENSMASDPTLKAEVDFQNDVINSIKDHRKSELKERLNSINVTSSSTSVWQKVAIAASTILISGGIALYLTENNTPEETVSPTIVESSPKEKDLIKEEVVIVTDNSVTEENTTEELIVKTNTEAPQEEIVTTETITPVAPIDPFQNAPSPNMTDNDVEIDHELDSENRVNTSTVKLKENGLKVYPENKKNRFHYKYDGKNILVQIADYSDETPAVLIDYPEKKEVFMNYNGTFYQLDQTKSWNSLSDHKISNPHLVEILKEKIK